jgi:hypothetical protein
MYVVLQVRSASDASAHNDDDVINAVMLRALMNDCVSCTVRLFVRFLTFVVLRKCVDWQQRLQQASLLPVYLE